MRRRTIYFGQIPLETDLLFTEQYAMTALARFCAGVLGTSTFVNGFTCTPTTPATLNVLVTPGEIYQIENTEQSTWSSLPTDTHPILKQGLTLDNVTFGITPPGTVGFSQCFLIECQYQDADSGSLVLPYYNAANPSVPFSGPGNAGTPQNTYRDGLAALQVKAGVAAATGTQTVPAPDAGWTGLFVVTVANGAVTITAGNIATYATAPFLPPNGYLPQIPAGVQNQTWSYWNDVGASSNNIAINPVPPITSYQAGQSFVVKMAHNITGAAVINVNGLGNKPVTYQNGGALIGGEGPTGSLIGVCYDGSNFELTQRSSRPTIAGAVGTQTFSTPGTTTFNVPSTVSYIFARVWAAGGGGGGGQSSTSVSAAAGGGEYREGWMQVTPGETLTIVVGGGGAGGAAATANNGGNGGNSSVTGALSSMSCVGGSLGVGAATGVVVAVSGAGGTGGSGGSFSVAGTPGGLPTVFPSSITMNGLGGGSFGCGWGLLGIGTNGLFPGQGGSGVSGSGLPGGTGANGRIVLAW